MGGRRIALVVLAGLLIASPAGAQPLEGELEMGAEGEMPEPAAGAAEPTAPRETDDPADSAEPAPVVVKDPKLARTWLRAAKKLVREGDALTRRNKPDEAKPKYENAITAYQKSIELGDDLGVLLDLASTHEKVGQLDRAATIYRTLIKTETGVRADVHKKATARFDELTMEIGLVTIKVNPEDATIMLAGADLVRSPMAEPIVMMPGTYTLSFAADGYQPRDLDIKVEAGSESERTIELEPIQVIIEPPPPVVEEPVIAPAVAAKPSMLPIYVGGGVAVGAAGIGLVTGILAVSRHGTFTGDASSPSEREDARSSGKSLAVVTDVMFGTAIVAAGFTAYWYFFKYKPGQAKLEAEAERSARSKVDVVPWVQSDAGGVSVAGWF